MKLKLMFSNALKSLFESVSRIFSPYDDAYPEVGVQPFEGEPYRDSEKID